MLCLLLLLLLLLSRTTRTVGCHELAVSSLTKECNAFKVLHDDKDKNEKVQHRAGYVKWNRANVRHRKTPQEKNGEGGQIRKNGNFRVPRSDLRLYCV
jgi:hypothetical protein